MTKKEHIILLSKTFKKEDIARIVGTSVSYVKKVISVKKMQDITTPSLTLENYAAAYRKGITRKNDLAEFFGVNRRTINRFENRMEIKELFNSYIELRNKSYGLDEVVKHLILVCEILAIFEPNSITTQRLKQVINLLTK